jgi:hypothetical protein
VERRKGKRKGGRTAGKQAMRAGSSPLPPVTVVTTVGRSPWPYTLVCHLYSEKMVKVQLLEAEKRK